MSKQRTYTLFLVEDEELQLLALKAFLEQKFGQKLKLHTYSSGEACVEDLHLAPQIVILDYHLDQFNDMAFDGIQVLKKVKKQLPNTEVIMLSGQEQMEIAVATIQHGAFDYVVKGDSAFVRIEHLVNNIIKQMVLQQQVASQKRMTWLMSSLFAIVAATAITVALVMGK